MWECLLPQPVRIKRPLDKLCCTRMPRGFFGLAPPAGAWNRDDDVECDAGDWKRVIGDFEALEGADLESSVALARLRAKRIALHCVVTRVQGGHLVNWLTGRGAPIFESGHFNWNVCMYFNRPKIDI